MDGLKYTAYQDEKLKSFEDVCKRCGKCCGGRDDDPCLNLSRDASGVYYCKDYALRLGPQRTASGRVFNCVPIREMIKRDALRLGCAYINVNKNYVPIR